MSSQRITSLTSNRVLTRSALWNFIGISAPLVVAFFAIPLLIEGMGKDRFGLLTLVWMGVGYFSVFDFGLGRALTKIVSERFGSGTNKDLVFVIWTALFLISIFGIIGGLILNIFSDSLVTNLLNIDIEYQQEAVTAFKILSFGVPVVIMTSAFVALLEARQCFSAIAKIRVPMGVLTFLGPLIVLQLTPNLAWSTAVLLGNRFIGFFLYLYLAMSVFGELKNPKFPSISCAISLLKYGGWLTISNIIGPFMIYFDRFFVGFLSGMALVAYYTTPYEVLSRIQIIPQSIMGAVFPAMSVVVNKSSVDLVRIYSGCINVFFFVMFPIISAVFLFANEWLGVWLGHDFQNFAVPVVHWLAVGWMVNALAQLPFSALQSVGRPDLIAKIHLTEIVPYLIFLYFCTKNYGISGAAFVWFLRVFCDALALNFFVKKHIPSLKKEIFYSYLIIFFVVFIFAIFYVINSLTIKILIMAFIILSSMIVMIRFAGFNFTYFFEK